MSRHTKRSADTGFAARDGFFAFPWGDSLLSAHGRHAPLEDGA